MYSAEHLKIVCPRCANTLNVRNVPGIENKYVTCPLCGTKTPFREFRLLQPAVANATAAVPSSGDAPVPESNVTQICGMNMNFIIGQLTDTAAQRVYQLRLGRNLLGRSSSRGCADIRLPSPTRRMSREHLVIEVVRDEAKGIIHLASLAKERVNPTFINNVRLKFGDIVILQPGYTIHLPDCDLLFRFPDEDGSLF